MAHLSQGWPDELQRIPIRIATKQRRPARAAMRVAHPCGIQPPGQLNQIIHRQRHMAVTPSMLRVLLGL